MIRIGSFLITLALVAGTIGCGGAGGESYVLTVDLTTGGVVAVNNVIIGGKAMFICDPGTVVRLNATPSAGYKFVRWMGDAGTIGNVTVAQTNIIMNGDYNITAHFERNFMVSAGILQTVGLKSDGTAVAVGCSDTEYSAMWGANITGWLDLGNWTGITQVAAGPGYTLGLRSDGTVVVAPDFTALGINVTEWLDIGNWTDIVQVATGFMFTVGLKSNGTVVATGPPPGMVGPAQPDVGNWTDIIQVSAGLFQTVGLKSDGTVVAVGDNLTGLGLNYTSGDVGTWTDIVQVSAGWLHTVGLRSDGTVVAVGWKDFGQCDVGNWTDIVQVAAGGTDTVGLRSDGTVVAVGWNDSGQCDVGNWTNIIQVATAGGNGVAIAAPPWFGVGNTLGLKSDGTVVAVGDNEYGQSNVTGWDLN